MEKLNKLFLTLSLIICIVCFGASVWMSVVLHDTVSYGITVLFFFAALWLCVNVWRSRKGQ